LRVQHRDRLLALLRDIFRTDRRANWLRKLRAVGVPAGPINDLAEAFGSEEM
jgi:crotonobetainyl-CoA:carnitine CoA-transferase CaiB-like acyl-CoA transferase